MSFFSFIVHAFFPLSISFFFNATVNEIIVLILFFNYLLLVYINTFDFCVNFISYELTSEATWAWDFFVGKFLITNLTYCSMSIAF